MDTGNRPRDTTLKVVRDQDGNREELPHFKIDEPKFCLGCETDMRFYYI